MKGIKRQLSRRAMLLYGALGFLLLLVVVAGATVMIDRVTPRETDGETALALGGPFALTAADGSTVTDKSLAGKPYAIFFGFTRCPDICPTSLARMAKLRKAVDPNGDRLNIVFVSVDPEHDSPADIGKYVALFDTPIIGLTGTPSQLQQIQKGFRVFVQKVPIDGGDYMIDHTATIYLMTADGTLSSVIGQKESDANARDKLNTLIG